MVEALMNIEALLGLPEGLEVVSSDVTDQEITLTVVSTRQNPCCPLCGSSASRVHSQYHRHLTDMSCAGRRVRLILHVRKFFCDEQTCVRKIFTERLVPFIQPWARVTTRFFQAMEDIGLATSGMLGARLGKRLGMPASWMTILRRSVSSPKKPSRGSGGSAGTSSGHSSPKPSPGVQSHASARCAIETAPETESKGSSVEPGKARGAPCPLPARRGSPQTGLLANGYCQPGRDRPCHGFALVAQ